MIHVLHGVIVIRMYVENLKKKDRKKEDSESVVIINDLRSGRTFKPKALIILIMECINRGVQI